jgi:hypothetical protein
MKLKFILAALIVFCATRGYSIAFSGTVLTDSFDARPIGALLADGGWTALNPTSLNTKRRLEVMADSGDLMGGGTANQILYFQNIADNPTSYKNTMAADGLSTSAVVMVSFDFYESSITAGGLSVYVGADPNAANPVNGFSLTDGALGPSGSYTLDAPHHLDAVFNEFGSTSDYDNPTGGVSSLGTGLMDIWIDNVRVAAGVT